MQHLPCPSAVLVPGAVADAIVQLCLLSTCWRNTHDKLQALLFMTVFSRAVTGSSTDGPCRSLCVASHQAGYEKAPAALPSALQGVLITLT